MRISDLLEDPDILDEITRPRLMNHAEEILLAAGYEKAGHGLYANVFIRPGENSVLKLFNAEDQAYIDFYNLVRNSNDIHFPKFKGRLMKITEWYYAARMEKLEPLPPTMYGFNTAIIMARLDDLLKDRRLNAQEERMLQFMREVQPGFIEVCEYLEKTLGENHYLDLHAGNVMLRGDTMVVTDPVSPKG